MFTSHVLQSAEIGGRLFSDFGSGQHLLSHQAILLPQQFPLVISKAEGFCLFVCFVFHFIFFHFFLLHPPPAYTHAQGFCIAMHSTLAHKLSQAEENLCCQNSCSLPHLLFPMTLISPGVSNTLYVF